MRPVATVPLDDGGGGEGDGGGGEGDGGGGDGGDGGGGSEGEGGGEASGWGGGEASGWGGGEAIGEGDEAGGANVMFVMFQFGGGTGGGLMRHRGRGGPEGI